MVAAGVSVSAFCWTMASVECKGPVWATEHWTFKVRVPGFVTPNRSIVAL